MGEGMDLAEIYTAVVWTESARGRGTDRPRASAYHRCGVTQ